MDSLGFWVDEVECGVDFFRRFFNTSHGALSTARFLVALLDLSTVSLFLKHIMSTMTRGYSLSILCALLTIIAVWAPPSFAQQEAGDNEIQLSGTVTTFSFDTFDGSSRVTTVITNAKLGRYFTRSLQVGGTLGLNATFQSNRDAQYGGRMGGFFNYSFLSGDATTVPYVGGQYSKRLDTGFDQSKGNAGVNVGVKFFINRYTAFDVGGNYLFPLEEAGSGIWLFNFGISFII